MDIKEEIRQIPSRSVIDIAENVFYEFKKMWSQQEVFYYTDISTFINGIIVEKPKLNNEICLWASRYSYMNDTEELLLGINKIKSWGAPDYLIDGLPQLHEKDHVISMTMAKDELPMWNTYGNNGKGVMLSFNTKKLLAIYGGRIQPCFYSESDYSKDIESSIRDSMYGQEYNKLTKRQKMFIQIFIANMYVILGKNMKYNYEKEVRIYGIGSEYFDKAKQVFFRYSKNKIIPYVKEYLPKSALTGVCFGPLAEYDMSSLSMKEFLLSHGFEHCIITKSQIPYRG